MRILSWNCRGLGQPSTISDLKESLRRHLPDLVFLCETKKKNAFVRTVCKNLKFQSRWVAVEPEGQSGGLLLCWSKDTIVYHIVTSSFGIEVEFETQESKGKCWGVFLHISSSNEIEASQWEYLLDQKRKWAENWFLGGDINAIKESDEQKGDCFRQFQNFMEEMEMGEVKYMGGSRTWVNNCVNEDFDEEKQGKCHRFLASPAWMLKFSKAVVLHVEKQSSDHNLLFLDANPTTVKTKKRFCFDSRILEKPGTVEAIAQAWNKPQNGSPMFQVSARIKECRVALLKCKEAWNLNSATTIRDVKLKMEVMQQQGGQRDWNEWKRLKHKLSIAYEEERLFWKQKSRIQWLKYGDKNTQFFHAYTMQRRKQNCIEHLVTDEGLVCESEEDIVKEISSFYEELFTTSNPIGWQETLSGMTSSITSTMNQRLTRPVDDLEIKNALFAMHPNKAPGPDGMTPLFFQKCWHLVGRDVCFAVKDFFASRQMLKSINHTLITLDRKSVV